jgi:transposase
LRDLVRTREAAKQDQLRARHRLSKFLLRSGQRPPSGIRPWTRPYLIWVAQLRFTQMAQEATRLDYLHEVERSTGPAGYRRYARQLMGYCGAVPSEDSSDRRTRRGSITKTGNPHLRRIVGEAAGSYHRPPCIWYGLRKRQESISGEVKEIAWKAQHRLHKRYMRLAAAGKDKRKITTAVARELLGFIWAIGARAETVARQRIAA